ncbi:AraC family transcriptional regulator [Marinobacter fonticola]|uniref:AraC family transcriptional regulator n=1 Tax=Marinobacter fonticola TaxID=2603215 RepID=UPI0011E85FB0|nr:AraC family transcriptional regulator [Marinobacter fonticola]
MHPSSRMVYNVPIVSVRYGRRFLRFMEARGIGRQALVEGSGIDQSILDNPEAFLSMNQVIQILRQANSLLRDETAGFEFGQQLDFPAHGLLGFALLGQEDPRKLVSMIVQYLRVCLPIMDMELSSTGEDVRIRLRDSWELGDLRPFMAKIYMGSIHALASQACGQFRFEFDFSSDIGLERWHRLTRGAEVVFDAPATQVVMPLSGRPVRDKKLGLAYFLAKARSREEMQPESPGEIVARVRDIVMHHPGPGGSLDCAARELGMSARSLRHHLASAGTTFREIRNGIRRIYATRYLTETTVALEVIAEKMGFSDQASFTRAYRSWTGHTPGEIRRHHSRDTLDH